MKAITVNKPRPHHAPEQTFEEVAYLRALIDRKAEVCVKLFDDEIVEGQIEYFDRDFIRVTRDGKPNLFIFKRDIKYLYEAE